MRKNQRLGVGPLAAHVDEVDRHTIDLGAELRIRVDRAFLLAPVVTFDPVSHQFLEVGGVGAVLPAFVGEVVGPAGALETRVQIVEHLIGHIDAKWSHLAFSGDFWAHAQLLGRQVISCSGLLQARSLPPIRAAPEAPQTMLHPWSFLELVMRAVISSPRGVHPSGASAVPTPQSARLCRACCNGSAWETPALPSSAGLDRVRQGRRSRQPGWRRLWH